MKRGRLKDIQRSLALMAFIGFTGQFAIPELHECPRLQPSTGETEHHNSSGTSRETNSQNPAHTAQANGTAKEVRATPPCHGSGASNASDDGSNHEHESCPVCQGYITLGSILAFVLVFNINLDGAVVETVPLVRVGSSPEQIQYLPVLPRPPPFRQG
ncbi:MAG: hypothetical protein RH862_17295 [Leptospiraceae bacterium]